MLSVLCAAGLMAGAVVACAVAPSTPRLEISVVNGSDEAAVLEVLAGIEAPGAEHDVTSSDSVPAGEQATVVLSRAKDWTLRVNGDPVYDSLHDPSESPVVAFGVDVGPDGVVRVLPGATDQSDARDPSAQLVEVRERAPYELREPAWLPHGLELRRVEWVEGEAAAGDRVVSVDLWFQADDGRYVHVWQTNEPADELAASGKDPVTSYAGTPLDVAGTEWIQGSVDRGDGAIPTLSARFPDGVTLSMDSAEPISDLVRIAASLR